MKQLAPNILANARKVLEIIATHGDSIVASAPAGSIDPASTISNAKLLLEQVVAFYADEDKASFFPHHADNELYSPLNSLVQSLDQYRSSNHPSHAQSSISLADQLYTIAMKLGIVTFGLDANTLKSLIEEIGAKRKSVRKTAEQVEAKASEILVEARSAMEKAAASLAAGEGVADLRGQLDDAAAKSESLKARLTAVTEALSKDEVEIGTIMNSVVTANEEALAAANSAKAEAKSASDSAKTATASLDAIQQSRANAKDELEEIKAFYSEIEQHQKSMLDIRRESEAKFNKLNEEHLTLQASYQSRTEAIVAKNEELQAQIQRHLQKSIGATLFHAFDVRRKGLTGGKWVWALIMIVAVAGGGFLSWQLADSLQSGTGKGIEPAFFVKLSALIPITFAIIFSARQYANERRTEEEYAFKSAISLSLEPYKTLLQQMKTEGHVEQAEFVEKLLLEIFDNPVARVYADRRSRGDTKENGITIKDIRNIVSASKDFDLDKFRQVAEILGLAVPPQK